MKEYFVKDMRNHSEFIDFFMVKSADIRVGSNQKEYLDFTLSDCSGDISAKKWDVTADDRDLIEVVKLGAIVKVKAAVNIWQGNPQLKILKIRLSNDSDQLDLREFIKAAPEKSSDMYAYIEEQAKSMDDEDLKAVTLALLGANKEKLMYYPAASKNHHAEYGGLLYHMKRMIMSAKVLCQIYTNLNCDLVVAGVIVHDMEKINEIEANTYGISSGYSMEGQLLGHIVQGVRELDKLCSQLNVPREKALMLEHMILSHHYEPEFGSPKKPMFPEAELLHYLDVLDARMFDMEDALLPVEKGQFSERIRVLDGRKLYKPTF